MFAKYIASILLALLVVRPALGSLTDDTVSANREAEEIAVTFMDQVLFQRGAEWTPEYTTRHGCFMIGRGLAGAHFLLKAKGENYVSTIYARFGGRTALALFNMTLAAAQKNCGANAANFINSAIGSDWSDVAKNVIEKNNLQRSSYDQSLLKRLEINDGQEPYDDTAPGNFPKSLEVCSEMGAIDLFLYSAVSFGDGARVLILDGGRKQMALEIFKHNFRYRNGGCDSQRLPLP